MNYSVIIGRLVADPELKYTPNGNAVTSVKVAVDREYTPKDGKKEADFIPVVVWGKTAENLAQYMRKGSQIAVQGRIQIRSWDDDKGQRHWATEVVANRVEFLGSGQKQQPQGGLAQQPTYQQAYGAAGQPIGQEVSFTDGDLPF